MVGAKAGPIIKAEGMVMIDYRRLAAEDVPAWAELLAAYGVDLVGLLAGWGQAVRATGACFVHWLATPSSEVSKAIGLLGLNLPLPYSRSPYYLTVKPLSTDLPLDFFVLGQWDCLGGDVL